MSASHLKVNSSEFSVNRTLKFRELSIQISELASSVGIRVIPFQDSELPHFVKLQSNAQDSVLHSLEVYLNVYKAVQSEGSSLLDSVRVLWNALAQLGLRPTSDLFSFVSVGNVIEIHGNNSVQMFRNLVFFNYCTYSLEELYCHTMPELYARDTAIEESLMKTAGQVFSGQIDHVIKMDLAPHIITEIASPGKLRIKDQIIYLAPLYSTTGNGIALISIENAEIFYDATEVQNSNKNVEAEFNQAMIIELKQPAFSSNSETSL